MHECLHMQQVRMVSLVHPGMPVPSNIPPSYLPRAHYKEYLVSLINAHSLDPATLYEVEELETAAERYLHVRPQPLAGEDAPTYHIRLLQVKPTPSLSSDSML